MLASLARRPPNMIALVHMNTSEEGPQFFGRDYARDLLGWIDANYREVRLIGSRPFRDRRFGIVLLERTH